MDTRNLPALLKDWKEDSLTEVDETLVLLEEIQKVNNRHQEILKLSGDLQEAYHQLLQKLQ